jgi:hypothetical protein
MSDMNVNEYERKPLRAHSFLPGVPLRTLTRVDLPGGHEGMTLPEISAIVGFSDQDPFEVGPPTKALFWLRSMIGRILRWDEVKELTESISYLPRLTEEDRARSLVAAGKVQGITQVLYCFENEFLGEIINRTAHCFWLMASERIEGGYALYMAVYVKKLNWFTPIYMALISPMLKWIIYPSMARGVRRRWEKTFPVITRNQEICRNQLKAKVLGEGADRDRHKPSVDVKSATHMNLLVRQDETGTWLAQCVIAVGRAVAGDSLRAPD